MRQLHVKRDLGVQILPGDLVQAALRASFVKQSELFEIQKMVDIFMKKLISGLLVLSLAILVGCAAGTPPAVGVWDVEMNTPLGALPATLTLNADGSGSMNADGLGEAPITGVTYDANSINFQAAVDAQGQSLVLEFSGAVDGDSLEGSFDSDFGAFGVSGSRQ